MEILKRINNNIVLAESNGSELIVTGKGIGFQVKPGGEIDAQKVEKRYYPEDYLSIEKMLLLLTKATDKEINAIQSIIAIFSEEVTEAFNPNMLFSLMDHILYAIKRCKEGVTLVSPFEWEIRRFYTKEYAVARKSVEIIRKDIYSEFPEEEAAFITFHFINALFQNGEDRNAYAHTELLNNILRIVKLSTTIEIDENSSSFQRFVNHIRYYLIQKSQKNIEEVINPELIELTFTSYPKEKEIADHIKDYLYKEKNWIVDDKELMYLVVHIGNILTFSKIK